MLLKLPREILSFIISSLDHKSYLSFSSSCRSFYKFDQKAVYKHLTISSFGKWLTNPEALFFVLSVTSVSNHNSLNSLRGSDINYILKYPLMIANNLLLENELSLLKTMINLSIININSQFNTYGHDDLSYSISHTSVQNDTTLLFLLEEKFNFNQLVGKEKRTSFIHHFFVDSHKSTHAKFSSSLLLKVLASLNLNFIPPSGKCLLFKFLEHFQFMDASTRDVFLNYLMLNTSHTITSSTGRKTIAHALHCQRIPDWFYLFHLAKPNLDNYGILHYMEKSDVSELVEDKILEICSVDSS